MKHAAFLIWLIAACGIALPSEGLASYLIKLKNGSQYVTSEYWEEGNQIKFNISGGQVGFSKESILKITKPIFRSKRRSSRRKPLHQELNRLLRQQHLQNPVPKTKARRRRSAFQTPARLQRLPNRRLRKSTTRSLQGQKTSRLCSSTK